MKNSAYLVLLLLLATSCVSQRHLRHQSNTADTYPVVPSQYIPTPVVVDTEQTVVPQQPTVQQPWQTTLRTQLAGICADPTLEVSQLGLYVYDLTDDTPLFSHGATQRLRPASCQKVVTAVTALHCLGGTYELKTDFRITGQVSKGVLTGDLIIVGGMDPLVTPAELQQAAATLRQQHGIERINGSVVYDLSMREDVPMGWGWCWDDDYGPLSALLVNGKEGFPAQWQKAMSRAGIRIGKTRQGQAPAEARSLCTIRHGIDELLVPMMKKSDNIYAECLFYQTAASTGKKQAGRKQAAERTAELMQLMGCPAENCEVADGSGLSLYNYLTAESLAAFLIHAWRQEDIRQHLLPSLPIASVDGTLQKRMVDTPASGNVRAKTGSVTGVSTLAGYVTASNGHQLVFAILNQGIRTMAEGRSLQDRICLVLCE